MGTIVTLLSLIVQVIGFISKLFNKSEKKKRRDKLEDVKRAMEDAKKGDMRRLTDLLNK